jgi:hypothetical protein
MSPQTHEISLKDHTGIFASEARQILKSSTPPTGQEDLLSGLESEEKAGFDGQAGMEALDPVVTRMKEISSEFGPQAFAYHSGRGVFEQSMADFGGAFL